MRVHDRGRMSGHLARELRVGDTLEVLPPTGSFSARGSQPRQRARIVAFAAGSGITPDSRIVKGRCSTRTGQPLSLFYGNRTTARIMFSEELLALKDRYPQRLALHFLMSREPQDVELFNGRLDAAQGAALGRDAVRCAAAWTGTSCAGPAT